MLPATTRKRHCRTIGHIALMGRLKSPCRIGHAQATRERPTDSTVPRRRPKRPRDRQALLALPAEARKGGVQASAVRPGDTHGLSSDVQAGGLLRNASPRRPEALEYAPPEPERRAQGVGRRSLGETHRTQYLALSLFLYRVDCKNNTDLCVSLFRRWWLVCGDGLVWGAVGFVRAACEAMLECIYGADDALYEPSSEDANRDILTLADRFQIGPLRERRPCVRRVRRGWL